MAEKITGRNRANDAIKSVNIFAERLTDEE